MLALPATTMPALSLTTTPLEDALPFEITPNEVAAKVAIMKEQEETTYRITNYLKENEEIRKTAKKPVDEECRVKMCEWCYQVVDFCKFRRETVGIGMSYLDRYLCTEQGRQALGNRKEYQLAAMTSLYIAIKIHEPLEMETSLLADLSRGCYTEMEFVEMEQTLLQALEWRFNGPTTLGFVQLFMALFPDSVHLSVSVAVMDYARYQTELSIADHSFVEYKSSEVALAAVLNAMEGMDTTLLPLKAQGKFVRAIERYSGLLVDDVEHIQSALSMLLIRLLSEDYVSPPPSDNEAYEETRSKSHRHSPVSVARKDRSSGVAR